MCIFVVVSILFVKGEKIPLERETEGLRKREKRLIQHMGHKSGKKNPEGIRYKFGGRRKYEGRRMN